MKKYVLFLFVLTAQVALCQTTRIKYQFTVDADQRMCYLMISGNRSEWLNVVDTANIDRSYVAKDFENNILYCRQGLIDIDNKLDIKDSLHAMKWELINEQRIIFGYVCLSAKMEFRGVKYLAYYAPELAYANGPWKFGGLPGLILNICSEDKSFLIEAVQIDVVPNAVRIIDEKKTKFVSWQEYVNEYRSRVNKQIKYAKTLIATDPTMIVKIKFGSLEIFYPEAQTGEGIRVTN